MNTYNVTLSYEDRTHPRERMQLIDNIPVWVRQRKGH
jgi:hypothetical protein